MALCSSHSVLLVAHAWHAAAGEWVTNEKALALHVAGLPIDSRGFTQTVTNALANIGRQPTDLESTIANLRAMPRPNSDTRP